MTSNPDDILTLAQTAVWFGADEAVLRKQAEEDGIPARRLGGEWYFSRTAILDWFRSSFVEKPRPRPAEVIDAATSKRNLLAAAGVGRTNPLRICLPNSKPLDRLSMGRSNDSPRR